MSSKNKRDRPIPLNKDGKYLEVTLTSQQKAISLLRECLVSHNVNPNDRKNILGEILKSLELPSNFDDNDIKNEDNIQKENEKGTENDDLSIETPNHSNPNRRTSNRLSTSSSSSSSNNKKNKKFKDEHNEFCDVCNGGGELICCDSCSLVFHLTCIRPKIDEVPKGRWSCAYCIVDDLGEGDVKSAKKAIKHMKLLSKGLDPDEEEKQVEEISIVKNGSKYVSRSITKKNTNELGRFFNLKEALVSTEKYLKKKDENEDYELWCSHCIDDPEVIICTFCGCQVCLGKHDSDYLIICDGCNGEIHTYCLSPPLTEIPATDKWYCTRCSIENVKNDGSVPRKKKIKSENSENCPITPKSEKSSKNNTPFVEEPSIKYDVIGIDNALLIISKFIKNGLSDKDRHFLEVFRQYSTYNDMFVVLKALEDQRDLIASKIQPSLVDESTTNVELLDNNNNNDSEMNISNTEITIKS